MFTNDDEFYLYGGLLRLTDSQSDPDADAVLGYEAYQYGPDRQSWQPGYYQGKLPNGVTRYVTNGAGVSVHSENLGFYFSGQRAVDWGPIHGGIPSATVAANTLISYDMSQMRSTNWTNTTLSGKVTPRASGELAWIPISTTGLLVAIGGVVNPEEIFVGAGLNDTQTKQSKATSPSFMTQVPVFDIAGGTWYLQNTTGDPPPQLAEFCSVVAPAKDSSSFNIYIYGGYDGLNSNDHPSDDVWILSLPSFTWIKAYSGTGDHGRRAHKCHAIYPDQMFVIGGQNLDPTTCVVGNIIEVFNLNTLTFQDSYDPATWSEYKVPSVVTGVIGGDVNGGATKKFPSNAGGNEALANLFSMPYTKTITNYYPYKAAASSSPSPTTPPFTKTTNSSSGLPSWAGAVIGVLVGVIGLSIIIFLVVLLRRQRIKARRSSYSTSVTGGGSNSNRIMRWVNGMPSHPSDHKSFPDTETDESTVASPLSNNHSHGAGSQGYFAHEVSGTERYELAHVPPSRPIEMPTPYNFGPVNPPNSASNGGDRSTDFAYSRSGGDAERRHSQSDVSAPTSTGRGGDPPSHPSPPIHPHSPDHVGIGGGEIAPLRPHQSPSSFSAVAAAPGSPSPMSGSRAVSPEDGHGGDRGDGNPQRPGHNRNPSSMSNHFNALPTPADETSPEEERIRSQKLEERLEESEEESRTGRATHGSVSGSIDGGDVKRKKSSFTEHTDG